MHKTKLLIVVVIIFILISLTYLFWPKEIGIMGNDVIGKQGSLCECFGFIREHKILEWDWAYTSIKCYGISYECEDPEKDYKDSRIRDIRKWCNQFCDNSSRPYLFPNFDPCLIDFVDLEGNLLQTKNVSLNCEDFGVYCERIKCS